MTQELVLRNIHHINYNYSEEDSSKYEDQLVERDINLSVLDIQIGVVVAQTLLYIIVIQELKILIETVHHVNHYRGRNGQGKICDDQRQFVHVFVFVGYHRAVDDLSISRYKDLEKQDLIEAPQDSFEDGVFGHEHSDISHTFDPKVSPCGDDDKFEQNAQEHKYDQSNYDFVLQLYKANSGVAHFLEVAIEW